MMAGALTPDAVAHAWACMAALRCPCARTRLFEHYRGMAPGAIRIVSRRLPAGMERCDVEQDLYLLLLRLIDGCRVPRDDEFRRYAGVSLCGRVRSLIRTHLGTPALPMGALDLDDLDRPLDVDQMAAILDSEEMRAAMRGLAAHDRETLRLYYWERLTMVAIARLRGCSKGTVSKQHQKALAALRKQLRALE